MGKALRVLFGIAWLLAVFAQAGTAGEGPGISAEGALGMLQQGNARYVSGKPEHPHQSYAERLNTAEKGQHPFATVLACSDSRVPVEILFDRGLGEIFVIRVAGNVANVDEVASMEYAVDHLGTPLLVVLGHTKCGAVTATVEGGEAHGNIAALVKTIVPAVEKTKKSNPKLTGHDLVEACIKQNVWQAVEDLFKTSPILTKKVKDRKLRVMGAIYHIDTGKVVWLGAHPEQDQLVAKYTAGKAGAH